MSNVGQGGREGDEHPSQEHTLTIFPYGCARHNTSSSCVIMQAERLHRREFSKSCAKSFHPSPSSPSFVFFFPHSLWNVTCIDLFVNLSFLWRNKKERKIITAQILTRYVSVLFFFFLAVWRVSFFFCYCLFVFVFFTLLLTRLNFRSN